MRERAGGGLRPSGLRDEMIELCLECGEAGADRIEGRPHLRQIQLEPRDPVFQFERFREVAGFRTDVPDCAPTLASQDRRMVAKRAHVVTINKC
jgi:hypothetical protein